MPTLTIDNQQVTVPDGTTVLEAAEQLGIVIPHFCYHQALGPVGACRMCAVTVVEGTFKGLKMSCLVKVEDGMVVTTDDQQSVEFRARVGEWLMLNHPHDCPVCDEGGECQLQEMTIASGHSLRRYAGKKRTYNNQQLGTFIAQEMNRCIQCYRCVRTYKDYCGGKDFGVMGSRNRVFFGRFKDGALESDFSGNIVDVCPTGVFTDKTYRFKSRYWDLQEAPSICPHCSLGCATIPGGRYGEVQRVRSSVSEKVNGFFVCDRGRFGSSYANHPERPRQAKRGCWQLSPDEALQQLDSKARELINEHGPEAVLLLGSNRASLETNWLLQRWAESIGCRAPLLSAHQPRHQAAQVAAFDLADRLCSLEKVRQSDLLVVLGADPLAEAPMLAVALRQAVRNGGKVLVYDPRAIELPCTFIQQQVTPQQLRELLEEGKSSRAAQMREYLSAAERPVLVAGGDLLGAAGLLQVQKLAVSVSNENRSCLVYPLLGAANSFGAALLSLPEQDGLLTRLESGRIKMLVCVETDPLLEAPEGERFGKALSQVNELAVLDFLPTPLSVYANLFIPTTSPVETSGTFINNEGRQQLFAPVVEPRLSISITGDGDHPPRKYSPDAPGRDPRPSWQLLLQLLGEDINLAAVREKMNKVIPRLVDFSALKPGGLPCRVSDVDERSICVDEPEQQPQGSLQLIVSPARYGSDLLSRFSAKLAPRFGAACVQLHPEDAAKRGLEDGAKVVLKTAIGQYNLTLCQRQGLTPGCAVVENGPAFPHLIPGGQQLFCQVEAGGDHD